MSKNSRYFSAYPTINPSYLSGGTNRQDGDSYTFNDIVRPNKNALKSNVIVQPNIDYDVFKNYNDDLEPISTGNFNVIGISVDTNIVDSNGVPLNNDTDITNNTVNFLKFVHMKPCIQEWQDTVEHWQDKVGVYITKNLDLYIGNYLQTGIFHYASDRFVNDIILKKYEDFLGL